MRFLKGLVIAIAVMLVAPVTLVRAAIYTPPTTDAAAWMFDPSTVVAVDLDLPQESLDALAVDPYTYVPATFTLTHGVDTYGPWNIEAKIKGRIGSYRAMPGKSAFKLKFPSSAQRINGLKKMTLNNMVQDPSKVHETVVYRLFRAMGVPAPRTGYATLEINGDSYGLYLNVETVDTVMLAKWFGSSNTTHLYEGTYLGWGNQFDAYDGGYEVDEGDENDRTDLQNLYTLNGTSGDAWFDAMDDIVDFQNMVRMWAVERYAGHWDGYSADIVNNFYFHSDAAGKFTMLPWGTDQTWGADLDFSGVYGGTLFVNCMNVARCRNMYVRAVQNVRDTAQSLDLATFAASVYANIRPHLDSDPKKEHSIEDADYHIAATQGTINNQIDRVNRWMAITANAPVLTGISDSDDTIVVSWIPAQLTSFEFSVAPYPVTGHRVFYRRAGAPKWRQIDVEGADSDSAVIPDLAPGIEYEVKVAAISGRRVWSASLVSSRTIGLPQTVVDGEVSRTADIARLRWRAPVSGGAVPTDELTYRVEMRTLSARQWRDVFEGELLANSQGWLTRRVKLPKGDRVYEFRIRAESKFGVGEWVTIRQAFG